MHPAFQQAPAYRALADRISMLASSLCLLHCVLLPLLLAALPFWTLSPAADSGIEVATLLVSAIAGAFALGRGYRRHRNTSLIALFGAGFLLTVLAGLSEYDAVELWGKGLGSLSIIAAHWRNARLARRCAASIPAKTNAL